MRPAFHLEILAASHRFDLANGPQGRTVSCCLMGMNHLLNNDDPPVGSAASGSASSSPTSSHSGHSSDRSSPDRTIKNEARPVDEEQAARTAASEGIGRLASMGSHLMLQVRTTSSPTHLAATGMTTPRLPPISMLTAAASTLQPRTRRVAVAPPSSSTASGSGSSSLPPHVQEQQEMLCRYRNKKCTNPRATKRNGDRHNLCERHRAKANQNQRKLESKRRTQKHTAARRQQQQQQSGGGDSGVAVKTDANAPLHPGTSALWPHALVL